MSPRASSAITRRSLPTKTLNDLFLAQLKDIYYAEKKIYRTLPKMVKASKELELKKAFTTHREETQGQIERLEQVFGMVGKRPPAKTCEAINGIVAEGEETIEEFGEAPRSTPISSPPPKPSNIMRWPATAHWQGGLPSSACPRPQKLLNETLQEDMNAEKLLTRIAKSKADKTAATKIAA
jgi:ferritin-like metal-binding protein YciE